MLVGRMTSTLRNSGILDKFNNKKLSLPIPTSPRSPVTDYRKSEILNSMCLRGPFKQCWSVEIGLLFYKPDIFIQAQLFPSTNKQFSAISCSFQPFSSHFKPLTAIVQPFPNTFNHFKPFTVISSKVSKIKDSGYLGF